MFPKFHRIVLIALLSGFLIKTGCSVTADAPVGSSHATHEISLLEENSLGQWKPAQFAHPGEMMVRDGVLQLDLGDYLTGVVWKGELPARNNFEIELEARKTFGSDFLLGLTVPVGDSHCTWICGGWGGRIVGISDINGKSADRNETTTEMKFEQNRWYRFVMRVEDGRIRCWIDGDSVIDVDIRGKQISMRPGEIDTAIPLSITAFDTMAEYRNIVWRNL